MRILANENIPADVVNALSSAGNDIAWIRADSPGVSDEFVLERALREQRLLVTFDKDFGQLAFARGYAFTCGVILFRFGPLPAAILAQRIVSIVASRTDWVGRFSVADRRGVRMVEPKSLSE